MIMPSLFIPVVLLSLKVPRVLISHVRSPVSTEDICWVTANSSTLFLAGHASRG